MKLKKALTKLIYLLIISSFIVDSYFKLTQLPSEADRFRKEYTNFQTLFKTITGYVLPLAEVFPYGKYIIGAFAVSQAGVALFVVLGQR